MGVTSGFLGQRLAFAWLRNSCVEFGYGRTAQLEDLMIRYGLRRRDVAELLGKPPNSAGGYSNSTVDRWLSGANPIPKMALDLLALKLSDREERPDPWQRLIRQPPAYRDQREATELIAETLPGRG